MKIGSQRSNLLVGITLLLAAIGISKIVFAAEQKQARVTEVIHDVRLLAGESAARPAVVNDTIHEGTAVRTGSDSRAELTFLDQTLTRLGSNTIFSFGGGARAYDLGSGAVLMTAPKGAGTIKISTAVATCAVSGFTAILERHSNTWNKVLLLEGNGDVWLHRNPTDHRHMHNWQMLVFRPDAKVLPQPIDFSICTVINDGLLFKGFQNKLPSWPLLVSECEKQQSQPATTTLIDPTNQDAIDQAMHAQGEPSPPPAPKPTIIPSAPRLRP
jgi:hypothetical protein